MSDHPDLYGVQDDNDPLSVLISKEKVNDLECVIDALPEECREVIHDGSNGRSQL